MDWSFDYIYNAELADTFHGTIPFNTTEEKRALPKKSPTETYGMMITQEGECVLLSDPHFSAAAHMSCHSIGRAVPLEANCRFAAYITDELGKQNPLATALLEVLGLKSWYVYWIDQTRFEVDGVRKNMIIIDARQPTPEGRMPMDANDVRLIQDMIAILSLEGNPLEIVRET